MKTFFLVCVSLAFFVWSLVKYKKTGKLFYIGILALSVSFTIYILYVKAG